MTDDDGPEHSPDILRGETTLRTGGRRLNRVPLLLGLMIGAVVIGAIAYTYQLRLASQGHGSVGSDDLKPEAANATLLFGNAPVAGEIAPRRPPAPAAPTPVAPALPTDGRSTPHADPEAAARRRIWQAYAAEKARIEQQRQQRLQAALEAPTPVGQPASGQRDPPGQPPALPPAALGALLGQAQGGLPSGLGAAGLGGNDGDPNKLAAKAAWLTPPLANTSNYSTHTREAAVSLYEVKAGTIISGVMISGINSDLPSQIIAQVRENVYDTATGRYLLIPQDARIIGTYDNGVSLGQSRVLVAWQRMIYPDGSSLDLGSMPGADQSGYAGFADQVNNHYGKAFGNALLLSLFAAGIQLSQPQAQNGQNYNSPQIIARSIGQQFGELGAEMARRGLNLAPTLEIRPGFRFNVMVTQDIVLKPWQG
jgi:type IV secretion system protein VirB10